jgi:hypothetical protein
MRRSEGVRQLERGDLELNIGRIVRERAPMAAWISCIRYEDRAFGQDPRRESPPTFTGWTEMESPLDIPAARLQIPYDKPA